MSGLRLEKSGGAALKSGQSIRLLGDGLSAVFPGVMPPWGHLRLSCPPILARLNHCLPGTCICWAE
eukprot:scaffold27662_cov19-Tisochrysis_lutea.AAC.3